MPPGVPDDPLNHALQPSARRLLATTGLLEWPAALRPFQIDGAAMLVHRSQLLLADDMGLGKTVQAAAALRLLYLRGEIRRALIVAPVSLLLQWRRELALWAPELEVVVVRGPADARPRLWRAPAKIHLAGFETVRGDAWTGGPLLSQLWDVVVLDEASRIKNPYAGVSSACKRIPAARRWALTGTPLENCAEDVVSILSFLQPQAPPVYSSAPAMLRARLAEVQLRRRKAEVLAELPPKHLVELPIELADAQRQAYDRAAKEGILWLSRLGDQLRISHILELILRLKQLCNHDPLSGESAKMEDLSWRLRQLSAAGHRALVFSQFTDSRFGIEQAARRLADLHPLCFTGRLSLPEREQVVARFRSDEHHRVMLLSLKAGGVGLNLQTASYVFHLDRWWNPATENQAEDRTHRMGQAAPVTVFRYLCVKTIEERVDELIRLKRDLFEQIIEPVSLDPRRFTKKELLALLIVE